MTRTLRVGFPQQLEVHAALDVWLYSCSIIYDAIVTLDIRNADHSTIQTAGLLK